MIAIVDYKAGNLRSVERALKNIGEDCIITGHPHAILNADRVIFPGVGAAGKAMEQIRNTGLDRVLCEVVGHGNPFLGICLGTQIILDESEEDGGTGCLGIIAGKVRRFPEMDLKIPHMGWNNISVRNDHPLLEGVDRDAQFYFVHSYYPDPAEKSDAIAETCYGVDFVSIMARKNVFATQFHPEKSGDAGLRLLKNFCCWDGRY
ncbi:MAG TPA: imidazole glycerol phosphate synthase subunit HisH [Desulfomonilia bacterium]